MQQRFKITVAFFSCLCVTVNIYIYSDKLLPVVHDSTMVNYDSNYKQSVSSIRQNLTKKEFASFMDDIKESELILMDIFNKTNVANSSKYTDIYTHSEENDGSIDYYNFDDKSAQLNDLINGKNDLKDFDYYSFNHRTPQFHNLIKGTNDLVEIRSHPVFPDNDHWQAIVLNEGRLNKYV